MSREVTIFTALVVLLVLGIFIMMNPHFFVLQMHSSEKTPLMQPLNNQIMPRGIITLASIFIIASIVGLCVLGFRIFKELDLSDTQKSG
jgi:hypothetical protein